MSTYHILHVQLLEPEDYQLRNAFATCCCNRVLQTVNLLLAYYSRMQDIARVRERPIIIMPMRGLWRFLIVVNDLSRSMFESAFLVIT